MQVNGKKLFIILNAESDLSDWSPIARYFDSSWEIEFGNHYDHSSIDNAYTSDVIISSTPYVRQHLQLLEEVKALRPNVLICIHPHEGFKSYTALNEYISGELLGGKGSFRTSVSYRLESIDRYFFWGILHVSEWAMTLIAENGLKPEAIRCVGSVYNNYEVSERTAQTRKPRKILYCSGCMTYGLYCDEDFIVAGDVLGGDGDMDEKLRIQHKLRETAIRDRREVYTHLMHFATNNQDISITVRLHPGECVMLDEFELGGRSSAGIEQLQRLIEEMSTIHNICIERDGMKMRSEELRDYDCLFHHGSTLALQAAYLRVPSLYIKLRETILFEESLPKDMRTYDTLQVPGRVDISSSDLTNSDFLEDILKSSDYKRSFDTLYRYSATLFYPWAWYDKQRRRIEPLAAIAEDIISYVDCQRPIRIVQKYSWMSALIRFRSWIRIIKRLGRRLAQRTNIL